MGLSFIYVGKHDQENSNDDEGAITHALRELGHDVQPVRELKGFTARGLSGDVLLFHKWADPLTVRSFAGRCCRAFWYFDLVDFPDPTLAWRNQNRVAWMSEMMPEIEVGFCTDGDWVAQDTTGKLIWLSQGADERVAGMEPPGPKPAHGTILFTGHSEKVGIGREHFVREMQIKYGGQFYHVPYGIYRRDLARLIATIEIVVAPDAPVTGRYWSNRIFMILGFGGFLLHPYCERLTGMYEDGKEIVYYRNRLDLHDKIRYYLDHPEERRRIAAAGLARTLAQHTYRHRCAELVQVVQERLLR